MDLLGDLGHVESRFSPIEAELVSVQDRCMVCARRTIGLEIVLDTPLMLPLGDEALVEARFSPFGDSANLDAR